MLRKRASINLLKGNYEGRNQGNCTSPVLLKGKSEGGKQAIAWKLIQCDLAWRLLPKRTSAILLKGNFERGEKGVAPDIP